MRFCDTTPATEGWGRRARQETFHCFFRYGLFQQAVILGTAHDMERCRRKNVPKVPVAPDRANVLFGAGVQCHHVEEPAVPLTK
jgi:hypothetical protein